MITCEVGRGGAAAAAAHPLTLIKRKILKVIQVQEMFMKSLNQKNVLKMSQVQKMFVKWIILFQMDLVQ